MPLNQTYLTTGINESYTLIGVSAVDVKDARGRGFKFDANGYLALAGAGDTVIGVGIMTAGGEGGAVKADEDITVQVKGMGRVYLAADVNAGDQLTTDANGSFVTVSAGAPVLGIATKAGAQDTLGFMLFTRG